MRRLVLLAAVAAVAIVAAPPADALTRKQADAIALRTLKPEREQGRVVVFALPRPLRATQSVAIARRDRQGLTRAKGLRPVSRKVWLYWEDLAYDAAFEHPSRLLLVDDATGGTVIRELLWYPLVDGLRPPFLRSRAAYHSPRWQIWSSVRKVRRTNAVTAPARPRAPSFSIPRDAFAEDCLLMVGQYYEWHFERDFEDLRRQAAALRIRTFFATSLRNPTPRRPGRRFLPESGDDVVRAVDHLADREGCKDIMIFLAGHGSKDGLPSVSLGEGPRQFVLTSTLTLAMTKQRDVTFKFKIQSCYAGRFVGTLMGEPNAVIVEASSRADEPSYAHLSHRGGREVENPGRSEFLHRNLVGMTRFAQSQAEVANARRQGGPLLARMLQRAFVLGARSDGAELAGLSHGVMRFQLPPAPEPPPPPPATLPLDVSASHEHPRPNPGFSYVCGKVTSLSGAQVSLSFAGPNGYSAKESATLGASGSITLRAQIGFAGSYTLTATASKDGRTATDEVTYDVPSPGGAATGPFACD